MELIKSEDKMENTTIEKIASGEDSLLNLQDASAFVGLKPSWIYQLTSLRRIPYFKRGRKLFFSKFELAQWLLENRVKTVSELDREAENRR
jgi:predicted DNA-binding transcriptional regulator AlpA